MTTARRLRAYEEPRITVPQVFLALGFEPVPKHTQAAGAAVARLWLEATGTLAPLERRQKTGGGGTHPFATYPEAWRARIEVEARNAIARHKTPAVVQPGLFDGMAA